MTQGIEEQNAIPTKAKLKSASLEIVVHRANGDVEDLGVVSAYNANPLINIPLQIRIWIRGKKRQWQQFLQTRVKK